MATNQELIPIYTDWANRQLAKSNHRKVVDLTAEFRDYRLIAAVAQAIVPSTAESQLRQALVGINSNIDGLNVCLRHLQEVGVNCSKVTATEIDTGRLGAVLQLLFALSTFKQQEKQRKKEEKASKIMPPSTTASKLPALSNSRIPATSQSRLAAPTTATKIQAPAASKNVGSKLATPKSMRGSTTSLLRQPAAPPTTVAKVSTLKPPSSVKSSKESVASNNNGSLIGSNSRSSSAGSTLTYSSIRSTNSNIKSRVPSPKPVPTKTPSVPIQKSSAVRTAVKQPAAVPKPTASTATPAQPKMMKIKLFGGKEKEKTGKSPAASPGLAKKPVPETAAVAAPSTPSLGLKPPSRIVRQIPTPKANPVQFRSSQPPLVTAVDEKRCSKSSEEDSAYAGFGSTSPASSTQSSISLRSNSSKGSREMMTEPEPTAAVAAQPSLRRGSEAEKPTLAVRALGVPVSSTSKAESPSKTKVENKEKVAEKVSSPREKPSEKAPTTPSDPPTVVGIVSPIVHRKNPQPEPVDCEPSSSKEEKIKPMVPLRINSRLEYITDQRLSQGGKKSTTQPPSYSQLIREGRIPSRTESRFDSSTSEDSLDSVTTTIRLKPSGYNLAGNTLDRTAKQREEAAAASGYTSEGGIAIYQRMQERMRELQRGHFDYGDSFEDSSSLSSGISDNFDDISTDDYSGTDHPMAKVAAAYGAGDYQPFQRGRAARSSSSSMDSRARRLAEQENIHQLLQQCRTSQRGTGCVPILNNHHLILSAEADALKSRSRSGNQQASSITGYHSLDRKTQFAEYCDPHWSDRAAMALVSPRRVPQPLNAQRQPPATAAQLTSGGMSRSLVLLESPRATRRRQASPRQVARLPLSVASPTHSNRGPPPRTARSEIGTYSPYRDPVQLHRLSDERSSSRASKDPMGSQLSIASSTAYANLSDKYESEIRKMTRELDGYRHTVSDYAHVMELFVQRLGNLGRHVEKAHLKPDEVARLRVEIDNLRAMSSKMAQSADKRTVEGAGELLRQPSLESVASMASHRSSMSSSSKSSKADKASLNSFGGKSKKSWIRSSFTKAFSKKKHKDSDSPLHQLQPIAGSSQGLNVEELDELKRQLVDREVALTDVRLDALDRAREVDLLRETVNRLKNENKLLKQDVSRLRASRSRASSQASLAAHEDEPLYEVPPTSSASTSGSSKRSSGCNSVKVTVNVDLRGTISTAICPDNEIIIGFLPMPTGSTTWSELDQQLYALFDSYIARVDGDRLLGLHCSESVLGYQMGDVIRESSATEPSAMPSDVISPTTTVRMFLKGATQQAVDSLVLESLFPRSMLEQLLRFLLSHRRLVLSGAIGIGKSNLARQLASYLAVRVGLDQDAVHDIRVPDDNDDKSIVKIEHRLEALLRGTPNAVVLLDNVPRHRIAFISSVFASVQLANDAGPFVICTVNRACQLPEMQVHHNFKMFLLTNRMEGVKGFMTRFLLRRIVEAEYRLGRSSSPELLSVIAFLCDVLQAVNGFIERVNSIDATIGPRTFLQCPLDFEESRDWFVRTWNENIIPYMVRVAREGIKVLGRRVTFESDPTEYVCERWLWSDTSSGEELLQRLSIKDIGQQASKQPFNPLDTLIRLQANRTTTIDNI